MASEEVEAAVKRNVQRLLCTPGYVQLPESQKAAQQVNTNVVNNARSSRLKTWLLPFVCVEPQSRVDAWSRGDCRWMPDEKCTKCFACGESFNAWTRRHHCRLCGQIFCHNCCSNWVDGPVVGRSNEKKSRLCEACTEFVDDNLIDRPSRAQDGKAEETQEAIREEVEEEEEASEEEEEKEILEHFYQPKQQPALEENHLDDGDAHGREWRAMADFSFRRFVESVRSYCMEVQGLEEQDHIFMICKLALQVVKQMDIPQQTDSIDILKYVKVKRVPGGHISDSQCYNGVVFSADVVHRKMEDNIENCPLTLIQMPLTFDKYNVRTDLDALRDQEQIYMDLKVEKIVKDVLPESPKLLMCQAVVSQLALERLQKRGIAVIIGVPEHILHAVSRCTGSKVITAVDSIRRTFPPNPECEIGGVAQRFYVNRYGHVGEEGYKALTVIEDSVRGKFSTVCLRGPKAAAAKPVLRWAIRLARHLQLESELLFELWCPPWKRELATHGDLKDDFESLEIITYTIDKQDFSCTPPEVYRFPAYVAPEATGGVVHDCAVRQWLESSLHRPSVSLEEPSELLEGEGPPLPECGKLLCFQQHRSRLLLELVDRGVGELSTESRGRSMNPELRGCEGAAITRWSLMQAQPKSKECGLTIEMWRYCRVCDRQVTPLLALSQSAGWHSMAKFLEMLLHNNFSSPVEEEAQCPHCFRDQLLLCSSPERPGLVISFKTEQVPLWRLVPPHEPFNFVSSATSDSKCFLNTEQLILCIHSFIGSVLLSLSTIESEDRDGDSPTLPAPKSESSLRILRSPSHEREAIPEVKEGGNGFDEATELMYIRQWMIQNRTTWHRVIQNLNEFHPEISQRLKATKEALGVSNFSTLAVDPLLVNTLRRDLLESFGEGRTSRKIMEDLVQLQQELQRLKGEDKKVLEEKAIQSSLLSLLSSAKETFKSIWTPEEMKSEKELLPSRPRSFLDLEPGGRQERKETLKETLPQHLDRVLKALGDAVDECDKLLVATAQEDCLYGIHVPLSFEDVGSLISYALLSERARNQMATKWAALTGGRCPLDGHDSCHGSLPSQLWKPMTPAIAETKLAQLALPAVEENETRRKLKLKGWKTLKTGGAGSERPQLREVLVSSVCKEPVKVDFEDKFGKYSVSIHFACQFHALRHWICGDDLNFVRSLFKCQQISVTGGKTGAAFHLSHDERFLLKALNKAEFDKLLGDATNLFWYFDKVLNEQLPSVLTQVIGLFTVSGTRKSQNHKGYYVVQKNLRFGLRQLNPHVFDLKGVGNRKSESKPEDKPGGSSSAPVQWDKNFREWTSGKPLCVAKKDLNYLEAAVFNDTTLLSTLNIMDYSLLLAAVPGGDTPGRLTLGIIDYLRMYSIDKKIESSLKTMTNSITQPHPEQPTVIHPAEYAGRFMRAMGTYFLADEEHTCT